MTPLIYAGADWSGRPTEPEAVFVFCVVVLNDSEAWNTACTELREIFGMARDQEFHGHEMRLDEILTFLSTAQEMGMRVGALLIDKDVGPRPPETPLNHMNIGLALLRQFLPLCVLQRLWCDEDIQGRKPQQTFRTEAQRMNRAHHPGGRLDIKFRKSHTSDLIQLADVVAYALSREARKTLKHATLEQFLKELRSNEHNLIIGPVGWGES